MEEEYKRLQDNLTMGVSLPLYEPEDIEYMQQPIGKAIYLKAEENISQPEPYWKQRVQCKFCGDEVSKSHYSKHRKTKKCMIYQDMHQKMRDIVLKK
jgi:hypothetical protein